MHWFANCCECTPSEDAAVIREKSGGSKPSVAFDGASHALKRWALDVNRAGQIEDVYDMSVTQTLGEGAFGRVLLTTEKKTEQQCAVKMVAKSTETEAELKNELDILSSVDHPNIVRFMERFEDRYHNYLVMEYCEGGELTQYVVGNGVVTEVGLANIVHQMLMAANYLHQHSIAHRDMKPQNWVFKRQARMDKATIKLIDFGVAKRFSSDHHMKTRVGTLSFVAPEILSAASHYNEKVDVWSIGVLTHLLISGKLPYTGSTFVELACEQRTAELKFTGKPWDQLSSETQPFIEALLDKDPVERLSAAHALEHPWLHNQEEASRSTCMTQLEVDRLSAYCKMHNFKKAALGVIVTQLDNKKVDQLKALFVSMDKNRDGTISPAEMREGFLNSGVDLPADIEEMMRSMDTDSSGFIDYTEFLAATLTKKSYHQRDVIWKAFKKFDKDGSGVIDRCELEKVILNNAAVQSAMHLDNQQLKKAMKGIDLDGDGSIGFEEFYHMIVGKKNTDPDASNFGRVHSDKSV